MGRRWWVAAGAALTVLWLTALDALLSLTTNAFDLGRFRWWLLSAGITGTVGAAAVAGVQAARSGSRGRVWVSALEAGRVRRVDLEEELAALLVGVGHGVVGVGTALFGAGGFGKTTLARQVCGHRRVRRVFRSAAWVTLGEEPTEAYLREQINDVYFRLSGRRLDAQSLEQAGQELGRLLDQGPRVLLVIDDVWRSEHLRPFLHGGQRCTRLVTTRRPGVVAGVAGGRMVRVDEFSAEQARAALLTGLTGTAPLGLRAESELLRVTGRWPLLVRMANRHLFDEVAGGAALPQAAERLVARLVAEGPSTLNLLDEESRNRAAAASIGASMARLSGPERTAFVRLGVFAEDLAVPADVLAMLWSPVVSGPYAVQRLCERLDGLSLLASYSRATATVRVHDVVRTFLRHQYPAEIVDGNRALVAAARALVPVGTGPTPWHLLPTGNYFQRYLCQHLADAGLVPELTGLLRDLRWAEMKLRQTELGALSLDADYATCTVPTVGTLRRAVRQAAHLLGPVEPAHSLADIVISRLDGNPDVAAPVAAYRATLPDAIRLTSRGRPPDAPHLALSFVLAGHISRVVAVALPADGSFIVTVSDDRTARVWDPVSGVLRHRLTGHAGAVLAVAVPADGSYIVTASDDRTARVWDPVSGMLRHRLAGHAGPVLAVAVPADGSYIATASNDRTAGVWDPFTGALRHRLTGHAGAVLAVAVPADGSYIVTASDDQTARVWDPARGIPQHDLVGHTGPVSAVAVPADGSYVVTTGYDRTARVWNPAGYGLMHTLTGHTGSAVAVPADGSYIVTASHDRTARVWDPASGRPRYELAGHAGPVSAVTVPADGSFIVTTSGDGTARVWDPATGVLRHTLTGHTDAVEAVAVPADGSCIVTGSRDETARVWDPASGILRHAQTGHTDMVEALAGPADGSYVVTGSRDKTARVWDPVSGVLRNALAGHIDSVEAVATPADGSYIVTGSRDRTARVWHRSGVLRHELTRHNGWVNTVAVPPDGSYIVTASDNDGTAMIWDPVSGALRHELTGHLGWTLSVAVPSDGSYVVTGSRDKTARVWDPVSGALRHELIGHTDWVEAVAVPAGGSFVVTGSRDQTARVWDPVSGALRHELTGHANWVLSVAVPADGSYIVTGSGDTARVWDPVSGALRHELAGHTDWVEAVAVSTDGSHIVTVGRDKTVRVWDRSGGLAATTRTDTPLSGCVMVGDGILAATGGDHLFVFAIRTPRI
ncbi:NB-ARC domain-containing protein [Dactylosporangium sp. NPDC049742]|uniref:NB-ARC domain-containing protein n=1 Tax=Dactylosporangium sp. NPDC049742 TaxID=3154737 RepID=UPI0034386F94